MKYVLILTSIAAVLMIGGGMFIKKAHDRNVASQKQYIEMIVDATSREYNWGFQSSTTIIDYGDGKVEYIYN